MQYAQYEKETDGDFNKEKPVNDDDQPYNGKTNKQLI
jgi:hypothetical protein